jgi:hypothetical protein
VTECDKLEKSTSDLKKNDSDLIRKLLKFDRDAAGMTKEGAAHHTSTVIQISRWSTYNPQPRSYDYDPVTYTACCL